MLDGDEDAAAACVDCDDTKATVYPGAVELCDGLDNDCDDAIPLDEMDTDGDTFLNCEDCGPQDPAVNPDAIDICNLRDDDCDEEVDELGGGALEDQLEPIGVQTFCWATPVSAIYVQGSLDLLRATETFDPAPPVALTDLPTCFFTLSIPAPGEGFYYLVRTTCPSSTWQTELAAEPWRDEELPLP